MRRTMIGLTVVLGLGTFANGAHAQDTGFSDPFFLYYGFYLPRQAALAAQPQPEDQIRANITQRQYEVQSERRGLYDPIATIGADELDPTRPFGQRSGSSRLAKTSPAGMISQNLTGRGPTTHYQRYDTYYPGMRLGSSTRRAPRGTAAQFGGISSASIRAPSAMGMMRGGTTVPSAGAGMR